MTGFARRVAIGRVAVGVADDKPTFWDRVEAGTWEPGTLALYRAEVGSGTLVLDLGAWVGPLALYAAALGARVVAVEADPAALCGLRRNLAANPALSERIEVLDRAVAAVSGPVRLGARRKPGDSMSSVLLAGREGGWTAESVTPAELAALLQPGERLFVKLDIEGGEYALLPHLGPLLDRPDAALLLSLHPGSLAATGEPDPAGRALEALGPLASWTSAIVKDHGATPAAVTREALCRHDTWLFRRIS